MQLHSHPIFFSLSYQCVSKCDFDLIFEPALVMVGPRESEGRHTDIDIYVSDVLQFLCCHPLPSNPVPNPPLTSAQPVFDEGVVQFSIGWATLPCVFCALAKCDTAPRHPPNLPPPFNASRSLHCVFLPKCSLLLSLPGWSLHVKLAPAIRHGNQSTPSHGSPPSLHWVPPHPQAGPSLCPSHIFRT